MLSLLKKFFQQDAKRKYLLIQIFFTYCLVRSLLFFVPHRLIKPVLQKWIQGGQYEHSCSQIELRQIEEISKAMTQVQFLLDHCLSLALTAKFLLARKGIGSEVVLGAKTDQGSHFFHAWLTCNGVVVVGDPIKLKEFKTLNPINLESEVRQIVSALIQGKLATIEVSDHFKLLEASMGLVEEHGLVPIVDQVLKKNGQHSEYYHSAALAEAALDLRRNIEIEKVLNWFEENQIPVVVLKGTALATTVYPQSYLRPRQDTDLLVEKKHMQAIRNFFEHEGYAEVPNSGGGELNAQAQFYLKTGLPHDFDIHWDVSNRKVFSEFLSFDEFYEDSSGYLGRYRFCRVPAKEKLLLHAAVHALMHHYGMEKMLWDYDAHLLFQKMSERDFQRLSLLAGNKKMAFLLDQQMQRCRLFWATQLPERFTDQIQVLVHEQKGLQKKFSSSSSWVSLRLQDFFSIQGFFPKINYLKAMVFPPLSFFKSKYQLEDGMKLYLLSPVFYFLRVTNGLLKILKVQKF